MFAESAANVFVREHVDVSTANAVDVWQLQRLH